MRVGVRGSLAKGRGLPVALLATSVALLASACHHGGGGGSSEPTGMIKARLTGSFVADVDSVQVDVFAGGRLVASKTVRLMPDLFGADAGAVGPDGGAAAPVAGADAFFVVPPGVYTVQATPLTAGGAPSAMCGVATSTTKVVAGNTSEITLGVLCMGAPAGGVDVVVTVSAQPTITGITIDPQKFIDTCVPVALEVAATAQGGVLSYQWSVDTAPAGAMYTLTGTGARVHFTSQTPGDFGLTVKVTNGTGLEADLSLPVHVVGAAQPACPTFSFVVDPAVTPSPASVDEPGGVRPLGAVRDDQGTTSVFVANELMLAPKSAAELAAFLARYGGVVLRDNAVPPAPADLGVTIDPSYAMPTMYLVRLDPSTFSTAAFTGDAQDAGVHGSVTISDGASASLLAIFAHERAAGLDVSPNFVLTPSALLNSTSEAGGGDGFTASAFDNSGNQSGVHAMWQFVSKRPPGRTSRVAMLDGGFWLNSLGQPNSVSGSLSDLPATPEQFDFVGNDSVADGPNPSSCTGGSLCKWHGNDNAGVATGIFNNGYGSLGSGGQVAKPVLFKIGLGFFDGFGVASAVRTSTAWKVDVVNMSFGMECDNVFCDAYYESSGFYPALREARQKGVVLVASAGNDGNDTHSVPCRSDGVICVGALANGSNTSISYSNFGQFVDIWAATNFPAMPRPDDLTQTNASGNLVIAGGTSAASPYIAGIAAVLKAYNSGLSTDDVHDVLVNTAWKNSPDAKVTAYVNAYAAVRAVAGNFFPSDGFEPDENVNQSAAIGAGNFAGTETSVGDKDYYDFTLADYTELDLSYEYLWALGGVSTGLVKQNASACASATYLSSSNVLATGGQIKGGVRKWLLPPGTWALPFTFGSDIVQAYEFGTVLTPKPLAPDKYEPNNSILTATVLPPSAGGDVTLHTAADADYYKITNGGSGGGVNYLGYFFSASGDNALALTLYDSGGNPIKSVTNSVDCTQAVQLTIPVGTWYVRVISLTAGAYFFSTGDVYLPPKPLDHIPILHKLLLIGPDPVEFVVDDKVSAVSFDFNVDLPVLHMGGAGAHMTLYDANGTQLGEGVPNAADPATGALPGETLSLAPLAATGGAGGAVVTLTQTDLDANAASDVIVPHIEVSLQLGQQ
jgi:hypothetical protein